MERMTDYKPQERQDLEELYRKQNVRINELEQENKKLKSEGVVIGGEDHKNYIEFGEYLKLQKEKEELEKEVERLQKVLYTITGSRDDGEPDLYEDVEGDLC